MDKASLVEQVKAIQRQDEESKQAWWTYCDTNLGGIKDPNRHDAATLGDFIHWYHAGGGAAASRGGGGGGKKGGKGGAGKGGAPKGGAGKGGGKGKDFLSDPWGGAGGGVWAPPATPPSWAAAAWGGKGAAAAIIPAMGGGGGGGSNLADFVKAGQRASVHWKNAWQTYCTLYGNRINDPSRHEDPHITGFIDYVGQLAYADLQAVAAEQGIPLDSGPVGGGGAKRAAAAMEWHQPPAKRGGGFYEEAAPSLGDAVEDAQKVMLVAKIKSLQRSNPEAKEAWWAYCEEHFKGHKDPNRHDVQALEGFLTTYGL